jgi:hypothetical protein
MVEEDPAAPERESLPLPVDQSACIKKAHKQSRSDPGLFVTDAELIRRLGVPEKIAYANFKILDKNPRSGFPKKSKLWGGRRYWPAVVQWFDRENGLSYLARTTP